MPLEIYHGIFGGWGWELTDSAGAVIAESREHFDTREECIQDARAHMKPLALASGASEPDSAIAQAEAA
jgi:hypothetical protein